jgi:hypothetical protein
MAMMMSYLFTYSWGFHNHNLIDTKQVLDEIGQKEEGTTQGFINQHAISLCSVHDLSILGSPQCNPSKILMVLAIVISMTA